MDFIFPSENKERFISIARKIGYSKLCLIYNLKDFKKQDKTTETNDKDIHISTAILTDKKFEKAKQLADFVITKAEENVRTLIENKKVNFVYGFEDIAKRDFIHYRNSGLNQVLCKLMEEKGVGYLVNLNHIFNSKDPQALGRVLQNIRLCQKYNVKIQVATFAKDPYSMRSPSDLNSLMKVLGNNKNK